MSGELDADRYGVLTDRLDRAHQRIGLRRVKKDVSFVRYFMEAVNEAHKRIPHAFRELWDVPCRRLPDSASLVATRALSDAYYAEDDARDRSTI